MYILSIRVSVKPKRSPENDDPKNKTLQKQTHVSLAIVAYPDPLADLQLWSQRKQTLVICSHFHTQSIIIRHFTCTQNHSNTDTHLLRGHKIYDMITHDRDRHSITTNRTTVWSIPWSCAEKGVFPLIESVPRKLITRDRRTRNDRKKDPETRRSSTPQNAISRTCTKTRDTRSQYKSKLRGDIVFSSTLRTIHQLLLLTFGREGNALRVRSRVSRCRYSENAARGVVWTAWMVVVVVVIVVLWFSNGDGEFALTLMVYGV